MHRSSHAARTPGNTNAADLQRGRAIYASQCQACHGAAGEGGIGPKLQHERERLGFEKVRGIVLNPDPPMPKLYPAELSAGDVRDVSAYVESL